VGVEQMLTARPAIESI